MMNSANTDACQTTVFFKSLSLTQLRTWSALFAGALLPLGFSPLNYSPLIFISLLLALWSWSEASPREAKWRGGLFGIGMYGVGASWIYISMHDYGNLSMPIAAVMTLLFILGMSLFFALQTYLYAKLFPKTTALKFLVAFPSLWVFIEWFRSWFLTGFPWLLLGYSQTSTPLRGFAPIIGVYGLSFLSCLIASLLWLVFHYFRKREFSKKFFALIALSIICLSGFYFNTYIWNFSVGTPLKVSLVQGNIPQNLKWSPEYLETTLNTYTQLTKQSIQSDLIIWPESAVPLALSDAEFYLQPLTDLIKKNHSSLIFGVPIEAGNDNYYNAITVLGNGDGTYYKHHLVPFGEYIPLDDWFSHFMELWNIPMSNFISGATTQANLNVKHWQIAPYICYEIAYSETVRRHLPAAHFLLTVSNDAWFGHSFAQAQHLQIAQMRSLQTGRYQLVASNNGISAVLDDRGHIVKQLPAFQTDVLTVEAEAKQGKTPWVVIGDQPVLALIFFLFAGAWFYGRLNTLSSRGVS